MYRCLLCDRIFCNGLKLTNSNVVEKKNGCKNIIKITFKKKTLWGSQILVWYFWSFAHFKLHLINTCITHILERLVVVVHRQTDRDKLWWRASARCARTHTHTRQSNRFPPPRWFPLRVCRILMRTASAMFVMRREMASVKMVNQWLPSEKERHRWQQQPRPDLHWWPLRSRPKADNAAANSYELPRSAVGKNLTSTCKQKCVCFWLPDWC